MRGRGGTAAEGGSIQVSERAYQQLQGGFLFRPRGVFYVPRIGTANAACRDLQERACGAARLQVQ